MTPNVLTWIDRTDRTYYTVADGDGQTTAAREAGLDVGSVQDLPCSAGHPFSARLNQILEQHDFDGYVEGLCERFYATDGRPGLPPGRYFRLLLIGYFEGLERRARDHVACRGFVCTARVSRIGLAGGGTRPFDDLPARVA